MNASSWITGVGLFGFTPLMRVLWATSSAAGWLCAMEGELECARGLSQGPRRPEALPGLHRRRAGEMIRGSRWSQQGSSSLACFADMYSATVLAGPCPSGATLEFPADLSPHEKGT